MVRSVYLRGFDQVWIGFFSFYCSLVFLVFNVNARSFHLFQQMANLVAANMKAHGTKFIEKSVPTGIEKLPDGKLTVRWKILESGEELKDVFDTVLFAIGKNNIEFSFF